MLGSSAGKLIARAILSCAAQLDSTSFQKSSRRIRSEIYFVLLFQTGSEPEDEASARPRVQDGTTLE